MTMLFSQVAADTYKSSIAAINAAPKKDVRAKGYVKKDFNKVRKIFYNI